MHNGITNNLFFSYGNSTNVPELAGPGAIFVTGRGNRYHENFQIAREKGAEVYAYLDIPERPINQPSNPLDRAFYMGDVNRIPVWGNNRSGWPGTIYADFRPGTVWANFAVDYIANLMTEGKLDGVFLDVMGAQLWSSAWKNEWTVAEKQDWVAANTDIVRRLYQARKQLNPNFKIINNNIWHDDREGEKYVDGCTLESPTLGVGAFHRGIAGRPYGDGTQRRLLVIADTVDEARAWAEVPGTTHVTAVNVPAGQNYLMATPALFPYTSITVPELRAEVARLKAQVNGLTVENLELILTNSQLTDALTKAENANEALRNTLVRYQQFHDRVEEAMAAL